jgi:hypothetical protein
MNKLLKLILSVVLVCISLSANAVWQCTVMNPKKNQTWVGTGSTRGIAIQNAMGLCSQNSVFIRNCRNVGCFQK